MIILIIFTVKNVATLFIVSVINNFYGIFSREIYMMTSEYISAYYFSIFFLQKNTIFQIICVILHMHFCGLSQIAMRSFLLEQICVCYRSIHIRT